MQFGPILLAVIVATATLSTVTLNDEVGQDHPAFSAETENPMLPESIRPSVVPTGIQLAADATDATTNAHNANTTPKSNKLFFETILNITETPREFRLTPGVTSRGADIPTTRFGAAQIELPAHDETNAKRQTTANQSTVRYPLLTGNSAAGADQVGPQPNPRRQRSNKISSTA
jgi:hypothetical protein